MYYPFLHPPEYPLEKAYTISINKRTSSRNVAWIGKKSILQTEL
jgi:hypothetical protein